MKAVRGTPLLLVIAAATCAEARPEGAPRLGFTIQPIPQEDRTGLRIALRFRGGADGETVLHLPHDRYGTPAMHEAVTGISAAGEASVSGAGDPGRRTIAHPPSAPVEVTYSISWDPARSEGLAYSPSVSAERFHFFGPQWIAWPEGYESAVDLEVTFADLPDDWRVLSSFGFGPGPHEMSGVVLDDLGSFIAGGAYRVHDFECHGKPVRVAVSGELALGDQTIFDNVERIVAAERAWMRDHSQPIYTVSITPREGIRAGTAVANAFVCLVDPGISAQRLNTLLAHEMFHYWLLGRARVIAEDFQEDDWASKWGYQWVDEGFTEYFARKILHETDLLSRAELVKLTNEDLEDYWKNEHRHIPYAELRKAAEERRFMNTHQRVGYYRGSLIALNWDTRIRQATGGGKSLSDAIREVIRAAIERGGHLPEARFHEIMARYGIDSREAFERCILRGETPPLTPDAYAPDYLLGRKVMHDFAPGFDVAASRRAGKIVGVVPEGHAHAAGLRDGMELIGVRNSRFYDPGEPMQVTVRTDGQARTVEFFPKGEPMRVPVYRPADEDG